MRTGTTAAVSLTSDEGVGIMTEWQLVQGSQEEKPLELDTTSSEFFVYQRKNIQRVTATSDLTQNTYEYWEYEERKLTKDEYARMREAELEDELTQTQLALAELYEGMIQNG